MRAILFELSVTNQHLQMGLNSNRLLFKNLANSSFSKVGAYMEVGMYVCMRCDSGHHV